MVDLLDLRRNEGKLLKMGIDDYDYDTTILKGFGGVEIWHCMARSSMVTGIWVHQGAITYGIHEYESSPFPSFA